MGKLEKWVMLAIGLVGGWVISTAPGWMHASSYEDWWGVATAVGTVSATIGAVGIAGWQYWIAQREKQVNAAHAAASAYLQLSVMAGEISNIDQALLGMSLVAPNPQVFMALINEARAIKGRYMLPDPALLTPLGGNCGVKLASAIAQYDLAITFLSRAVSHFTSSADVDLRRREIKFISHILTIVIAHLSFVSQECQKIAIPLDSPYH